MDRRILVESPSNLRHTFVVTMNRDWIHSHTSRLWVFFLGRNGEKGGKREEEEGQEHGEAGIQGSMALGGYDFKPHSGYP